MYEQMGAIVDHNNKTVQFKLFFPDHELDSNQYYETYILPNGDVNKGSTPKIKSIKVIGDFQDKLIPSGSNWDEAKAPVMKANPYMGKGYLYQTDVLSLSADGFYQYKLAVTFEDGEIRICNDPCTKYHSFTIETNNLANGDKSGFVVGGNTLLSSGLPKEVTPLREPRLPLGSLVIYELSPDEFTMSFRGNRAPLDAITDKIDHLVELGINAIELMPVYGCPNGDFTWGYTPAYHFTVSNRYANDSARELEKLSLLKKFISKLHDNGIHVILDIVLNHVSEKFPYYELYKDRSMSPYVSVKEEFGGKALDFYNNCTTEFIVDLLKYWIDVFKVDGFRLDYALGFLIPNDAEHGLAKIIADINTYIASKSALKNTSIIMELLTDNRYDCINITNTINATGCWFDPTLWNCFNYVNKYNKVDKEIVRILNSGSDFASEKFPVPYIENHDHTRIIRKIDEGSNFTRGEWWRTQPYIIALMTAAGAPLIFNGQEWGEDYWMPEGHEEEPSGIHRVVARPIHWEYATDQKGRDLFNIYKKLINIRKKHPACMSFNFYPKDNYSGNFNNEGYGFDYNKQIIIYHKWDNATGEKLITVINFTNEPRMVNIPFSHNGSWTDVLSGKVYQINDYWLYNMDVPTNWGYVFTNNP